MFTIRDFLCEREKLQAENNALRLNIERLESLIIALTKDAPEHPAAIGLDTSVECGCLECQEESAE